ncbi:MAG TPA: ferredoxin reductase [Candidatus Dormibacteraeota bacterium]
MARAALLGRLSWRPARIAELVQETPRAASLHLDVPGWPGHLAGQHVDVRLTAEDGYQAQRSYSIASAPGAERLTLTIERLDDGEVSPYLVGEARVGDGFELRGPVGLYFAWQPEVQRDRPVLLIGGGSGVVPLMAMLRLHAATGAAAPMRLLYSSRSIDEVIYRDELDQLNGSGGREVRLALTRSQPPGWTGYARRLDKTMLSEVAWPPSSDLICYICGPTSFVEAAAESLVQLGHAPGSIRTERFGATGG